MIESDGTGTMSGTLRSTLYYPSEQVSSHLHRRFSIAMAEHARCRLSESVYVHAIDESDMINPVDHSGGFGGFRGCVLARAANISPPKRGLSFCVGRVANPPNPYTPQPTPQLQGMSACLMLPGVPWSLPLSWLHTALAGSCYSDSRLSSHALIRSPVLCDMYTSPCYECSLIH